MFHDPGYIAQDFWAGVDFNLGLITPDSDLAPEDIPEAVKQRLLNSWETGFAQTRQDLVSLVHSLAGNWAPQKLLKADSERIDSAIGKIFFDGQRCGHSLVSGLTLISRCLSDQAAKGKYYDAGVAHTACQIAALSMLFHDEHARSTYLQAALTPLSFEALPYAAILVFVDSLQDDRRDIRTMKFPKNEVLCEVNVDRLARRVRATVDLSSLPSISWWPWKIAEYNSATNWLNRNSNWVFEIDYRSKLFGRN